LIVEDDPMVAMINEQYVRKNKQFKVCASCRNGQEALDFLEENSADLIIMDVYMPIMDGVETCRVRNVSPCATGACVNGICPRSLSCAACCQRDRPHVATP